MREKNRKKEEVTVKFLNKQISIKSKKMLMKKFLLSIILFIIVISMIILSIYIPQPEELNYKENSNLDYQVYLKKNKYYETQYLGKNMQYIASLIDYINVNFKYNFDINENINYKYNYYIEADVRVFDKDKQNNIIFEKTEKLLEDVIKDEQNSKNFSIDEKLKIDYAKYNNLIKQFKTEYSLTADSTLTLTLYVEANGNQNETDYPIKVNDNMKIIIPLTEQMININMDYKEVNDSGKIGQVNKLNINNILRYISIAFACIFVVMIINTARFISKINGKKTYYQRRVDKILKNYDRVVVKLKKSINISENDEIIEVVNFEELLGISDRLCKSILFMETNEKEKGWFIVKNGSEIYRYIIEENSL